MTMTDNDNEQTVLVGNDGGFGLPDAREYEREDGTTGVIPPDEVFLRPLRTRSNGWQKYHAVADCGSQNVYYMEDPTGMRSSERHEWKLYCATCGHGARWQDVLFISDAWYWDRFEAREAYDWRRFEKLHLSPERVLELGPDPMESALIAAIDDQWEEYQSNVDEMQDWWDEQRSENQPS